MIPKIFQNFISNKIILCNDKDPSWFNDETRHILNKKDKLCNQFINNSKLKRYYDRFQCVHSDLVESTRSSKEKLHFHLSAKLSYPLPQQKPTGQYLKPSLVVKKSL